MEKLKLNFDTVVKGETRTYTVEVPYQNGIVATSEYCPTEFLSGTVDIMAAVRGESLDKFIADSRMQLLAISQITDADTELDRHIGGLMAVIMEHLSRKKKLSFGDLLIFIDCFSLLLKAAGFERDEIHSMYPKIARTILDIYPDNISNVPDMLSKDNEIHQFHSK